MHDCVGLLVICIITLRTAHCSDGGKEYTDRWSKVRNSLVVCEFKIFAIKYKIPMAIGYSVFFSLNETFCSSIAVREYELTIKFMMVCKTEC